MAAICFWPQLFRPAGKKPELRRKQHVGGMAERFKAPVLKTGVGASSPWVRIPLPPPFQNRTGHASFRRFPASDGDKDAQKLVFRSP